MTEKQWLEQAIKTVLKAKGTEEKKLSLIMLLVDSYEGMVNMDSNISEMSDVAKETFGLGADF